MKKTYFMLYCFLAFFCCFVITVQAQKHPKVKKVKVRTEKAPKEADYYDPYEEEEYMGDISWKQKGFEFYIGGGAYFASKKTANYYNGAPENDINLNLLFNKKEHRNEILLLLKETYNAMDTMTLRKDYNEDSRYSIAMDVSLGARYRFKKNWYCELSYSFRRVSCENKFIFDNPYGVPGNKENPPYTNWENLIAKEDRHYIDVSAGYIFQNNPIAKPFISLGVQFNYVNIQSFLAIIEGNPFDLMEYAKNPNYNIPGAFDVPNYRVWKGAGYGFSFTAGLKLVVNQSVSLDPVFQLSVGSFGNNKRDLPGFYTNLCFNYMVGVRIVINDALFFKK